jgi:hypothetical protein
VIVSNFGAAERKDNRALPGEEVVALLLSFIAIGEA